MSRGRFGDYGGQYISETLMNELINLEEKYEYYKKDKKFNDELNNLLNKYAGRPSLLYYAEKMTNDLGYASIFWSFAYVDWYNNQQPTHEFAKNKIYSRTHPGAIVLLHSNSQTNSEILDEVITHWEDEGYTLKSLDYLNKKK